MIVQDKTYEISASAGKKIKMTFAAFSLENAWRCGWDYLTVSHHCNIQILITVKLINNIFFVQIVDGNGRELLGKSCGSVKPATVTSQTNKYVFLFSQTNKYFSPARLASISFQSN